MTDITQTPDPPYYAVIFTSLRTDGDNGYASMAERMNELAALQPGCLGLESVRDGLGITVSYWANPEAIQAWHHDAEHLIAQRKGYKSWYQSFKVRVCKVERDYGFERRE
jgi:heme-degrading monooxygenase HmoA